MSEGLLVHCCRYSIACTTAPDPFPPNVEHHGCVQVEHSDSDNSICDVTLQGSPSDCCTAVLQILHHASAAHAQNTDWTRKDFAQAAWQLKHQVSWHETCNIKCHYISKLYNELCNVTTAALNCLLKHNGSRLNMHAISNL